MENKDIITPIYNALLSKCTRFTIEGVEIIQKVITGTQKQREVKCKEKAEQIASIINF